MTVTTVEPVDNDDESYDGEDDELEVLGEDVKDIEDENDNEQHASEIIIPEKETLTKKKKFKRKKWLTINLSACKYDSVRRVSRRFGMREVADDEDWMLYWTDFSVSLDRVMEMKKYQKINHFPGMAEICRKDLLARNLNRLHKLFPKDYNIFPRSWCLPADYGDFQAYARTKKNKSYISKPASGSQGHGIWVTKSFNQVKSGEHMVLQQYISKPLLLDGFKFDLRLYVLITSCDPLRLYLYEEGMVRLATIKYSEPTNSNLDEQCMHLTNYAINKHSSDFIRDDISGSKRRFSATLEVLEERGIDIDKLHHDICDVIIKTFISAHPILKHNYRTCFTHHIKGSACFEILGFDILLDRKCRPYVIEVNHSPSFTTDAPFDKELKEGLIMDALNMLNFSVADRRKCVDEEKRRIRERLMNRTRPKEKVNTETPVGNLKEEHDEFSEANIRKNMDDWELNHNGMYRLIYPTEENKTAYDRFFEHSGTLFGETAASKARGECARQLRDEIQQKQDKLLALSRGTKPRDRSLTRPESPGSTKRIFNRPKSKRNIPIKTKPQNSEGVFRATVRDDVNTMQPQPISDSEEMERLNSLLIRDNLLRAMGVVEQVYRLLQPSLDGKPTENGKERYFSGISKPPVPAYVSMSTLNKPTKAYLSQMNQRSILLQRYNSRSQLADALDIDVEDDKRPRASSAHNRSKDQEKRVSYLSGKTISANVQPYLNVVAHPAPMIQNGNFNVVHVPLNRREPFARGARNSKLKNTSISQYGFMLP